MRVKTLLEGEIEKRFEDLEKIPSGTEEHKTSTDALTKLIDRDIEMEKLEIERVEKIDNQKIEQELKMRQMKEEKTSRWTRDITNWVNLVGGAGLFVWGLIASTNFEREGTFTTSGGKYSVKKVLSWFK